MSFALQRVTSRGLVLSQIDGTVLRIGRGTSAELRSDNPAVALEHAIIEQDAAGFSISDKGSITGTYVNGKAVESARLSKGDVIEAGDLRLEVQLADPGRPLFLRVVPSANRAASFAGDAEEEHVSVAAQGGEIRAPRVDYASGFQLRRPYLTKLSMMAILAIVSLTVTSEVVKPENQSAFMPGGVSSAHAHARDARGLPVAKNCNACHSPWKGVTDEQCTECHGRVPHAAQQADAPPCISCHAEHRGAVKLAVISDNTCVTCHADLTKHVIVRASLAPQLAHVRSFRDGHPDYTYPRDTDVLLFNHKLHLRAGGILNANGKREVLACTTCHKLVTERGKADPKRVTFAADCQRCHKLTFDARMPDLEVPHGGDPGLVYGFVVAAYSGQRDLVSKSPEEIRRILTARKEVAPDERAVLNAEQVIKTKCALCHEIQHAGTRLAVTPPNILDRWLNHAKFTHTPHANVDCERCHDSARRSTKTADVLMPQRQACVECHGYEESRTSNRCVTCHEYHERSKSLLSVKGPGFVRASATPGPAGITGGGLGMLETILLIAVVLLLLVVLVPLGVAMYQRLRPREDVRPRRDPMPMPVVPTERIPALAVPSSSDQPAPPPPPREPVKATYAVPLEDAIRADQGGGATQAMQWFGMLLCTSGPLEGQRFVVEEQGLYIGRDPALSQIVINDSRISKRHVRIVPRDGRAHAIDEGSTNGTFLASAPKARITDVQLKRGDTIILGDNAASFTYQI